MEKEIIISKKTGKKQAMPVLIGDCLLEMGDGLAPPLWITPVTQLPPVCAKLVSQRALIRR
jgi:hypothetical protein